MLQIICAQTDLHMHAAKQVTLSSESRPVFPLQSCLCPLAPQDRLPRPPSCPRMPRAAAPRGAPEARAGAVLPRRRRRRGERGAPGRAAATSASSRRCSRSARRWPAPSTSRPASTACSRCSSAAAAPGGCAITLIEEASGLLVVEAALGYPRTAGRVRYRVGEGITGGVAQRGTPAVVPRVSEEPRLPPPRGVRGTSGTARRT